MRARHSCLRESRDAQPGSVVSGAASSCRGGPPAPAPRIHAPYDGYQPFIHQLHRSRTGWQTATVWIAGALVGAVVVAACHLIAGWVAG